jgi:hypothetical protein
MPSERVRNIIIAVVTTVWAVNFAAGLIVPEYDPDPTIHAVFMSIVGGLLAIGARNDNSNSRNDKRDDS